MNSSFRRVFTLTLAMLASACDDSVGLPAAMPPATSLVDGSRLAPDDDIAGLDVASDGHGTLHVVWRERIDADGPYPGERIVYRRGTGHPLRWSRPAVVSAPDVGAPQVAADVHGAHVLAGSRLHYWQIPADGRVIDHGPILAESGPGADTFDAVAARGGVTIVYRAAYMRGDPVLYSLHRAPHARAAPVAVSRASHATVAGQAPPRLFGFGTRLLALWSDAVSAPVYDPATRVTAFRAEEELHAAWSGDGGQTWTPATDVAAIPNAGIAAIDAAGSADAPVVFLAAHAPFLSRWEQGGWTAPVEVPGGKSGTAAGRADVTALAVAECRGQPWVAWVDARFRRSDRRWWNPLGGFPWSDDPDWDNNDLFVFATTSAGAAPRRLSIEGSYTGDVAMASHGDELVLVHTGRARAGKSREAGGAPPRVLVSRLACG